MTGGSEGPPGTPEALCQCWVEASAALGPPSQGPGIRVARPHVCMTTTGQKRGPRGQSAQSPFGQEVRKYTTRAASRAGPRQRPGPAAFSVRGSSVGQGRPGPCKSRVLGAAGQRHWWGPVGPDGLLRWHLGPAPSIPPRMPKASVAVAYGCGQALPQQGPGLLGARRL